MADRTGTWVDLTPPLHGHRDPPTCPGKSRPAPPPFPMTPEVPSSGHRDFWEPDKYYSITWHHSEHQRPACPPGEAAGGERFLPRKASAAARQGHRQGGACELPAWAASAGPRRCLPKCPDAPSPPTGHGAHPRLSSRCSVQSAQPSVRQALPPPFHEGGGGGR